VILPNKDVKNLNLYVIIALTATYFMLIFLISVFYTNLVANFEHKINRERINFPVLYIIKANKVLLIMKTFVYVL
jgi:hypothetical protein